MSCLPVNLIFVGCVEVPILWVWGCFFSPPPPAPSLYAHVCQQLEKQEEFGDLPSICLDVYGLLLLHWLGHHLLLNKVPTTIITLAPRVCVDFVNPQISYQTRGGRAGGNYLFVFLATNWTQTE